MADTVATSKIIASLLTLCLGISQDYP